MEQDKDTTQKIRRDIYMEQDKNTAQKIRRRRFFLCQKLSTLISFSGFIGDEPLQNVGSTDLPSEIRALYKLEESARILFNERIPTAGLASISMVILWIFGLCTKSPSLCP